MIVCGDDVLAARLASELHQVYRQRVTLVAPPAPTPGGVPAATSRTRISALLGRAIAPRGRGMPLPPPPSASGFVPIPVREIEAAEATEEVLRQAGAQGAAALAVVYDDDVTNIRVALAARRLNPRLRLVIRLYNRKLGQHLADLLDQAAAVTSEGPRGVPVSEATTTVLSDADTAAPALAGAAIVGTRKVVQADGLLLHAVERTPPGSGEQARPGLCTLALLSSTADDPGGAEGTDGGGPRDPLLLPDDETVAAAVGRRTVVLEAIIRAGPAVPSRRRTGRAAPLRDLIPSRLLWAVAGIATSVVALAVALAWTTGDHPLHAAYLTLLDLFAIGDPAVEDAVPRQILQLVSGLAGLALLPILVAAGLQALGAFRGASALRRPPRGLSGHVVLLGLGKVGTRVLEQLRELDVPVVCVEEDPEARGIPLARRLGVPVVLGDATQEGPLESAKIHRARALLALTSSDATNLEASLYARTVKADVGVVLRLYDDDFATAVFRTLRAAHPKALTRSRSVSTLAAPAFAGAMMGRHVLGAVPVERTVLLFAAVEVRAQPRFRGRTVAEVNRPGAWRIIALDTAAPDERGPDLASSQTAGLLWDLHPGYVLRAEDRVVLAATRQGFAELLGQR
ncbi:potassium channel family protein [Streptomyces avicenniae]|uniref:potassium channel family protein n=1 Tax=Streptomyces avicenniae TaxID=500153 RepID=UPI00069ABA55|nr:potassium channel protein [Streptomyces avicenniae]